MSEEKGQKHLPINIIIAIMGIIALLGVVVFVLYKIGKTFTANSSETVTEDSSAFVRTANQPNDTLVIAATKAAASRDSAKIATLYINYFSKDTVPDKYPKYLQEALTGYAFGEYSYLKKLDLENLEETIETIESNKRQTILDLGHYYKGIAGLVQDDAIMAMSNLQWAALHALNTNISIKARWYLALSYMKTQQVEKAIPLLKAVAGNSSNAAYRERAKSLLPQLKMN